MLWCGELMSVFLDVFIGEVWWVVVILRGGVVWRCFVFFFWIFVFWEEGVVVFIFCCGRVVCGLR